MSKELALEVEHEVLRHTMNLKDIQERMKAGLASEPAKLTFFAGQGSVETVRWMLAVTNVEASQIVFNTHEELRARHADSSLMFEDLPLLEIDGLKLVGTHVICRYLGRRAGLCGSTAADQASIDAFAEAVREAREPLLWYPFIADKEEHKQRCRSVLQRKLPWLERTIQNCRVLGQAPGLKAADLTYADVLLAEMFEAYLRFTDDGFLSSYEALSGMYDRVRAHDGVSAYLRNSGSNDFFCSELDPDYCEYMAEVLGHALMKGI